MKQYFHENDELSADEVRISVEKSGQNFIFFTRRGLFSYKEVDANSIILATHIPKIKGKLLDLGCGYGAIGIMLAKINPQLRLTGCDINRIALDMASKNAKLNGVTA